MGNKTKTFELQLSGSEWNSPPSIVSGSLAGRRTTAQSMKEAFAIQDYVRHIAPVLSCKPLSPQIDISGSQTTPDGAHTVMPRLTHGYWILGTLASLATVSDRTYVSTVFPNQTWIDSATGFAMTEDLAYTSEPPGSLSTNYMPGFNLEADISGGTATATGQTNMDETVRYFGDIFFDEDDPDGVFSRPLYNFPLPDYAKSLALYLPYNISTADLVSFMGYLTFGTLGNTARKITISGLSNDFTAGSSRTTITGSWQPTTEQFREARTKPGGNATIIRHVQFQGIRLDGSDSE